MRTRRPEQRQRPPVAQPPQALDARERHPPVGLVGRQQALQGRDQGRYGLRRAQLGEQPYRLERVRGAQHVRRERGGGARRTGVAQPRQRAGGRHTALGVAVVQEQHQRLERPPVARGSEPVRRDLPCPQGCRGATRTSASSSWSSVAISRRYVAESRDSARTRSASARKCSSATARSARGVTAARGLVTPTASVAPAAAPGVSAGPACRSSSLMPGRVSAQRVRQNALRDQQGRERPVSAGDVPHISPGLARSLPTG